MPEISAKWVVVVRGLHRAECLIPGCDWKGEPHGTYQEANAGREAHLQEHRETLAAWTRLHGQTWLKEEHPDA